MTNEVSTVIIVPTASKADLEKVFCAWGKSDLPGYSFSVALSSDGTGPATHYACHEYVDADMASAYMALPTGAGTLPAALSSVTWDDWGGMTLVRAVAACAASSVFTGSGVGSITFAAALAELELQAVE